MVISSELTLAAPPVSHQHHEIQGNWRRGWDTHPGLFAILACFQQHAEISINIDDLTHSMTSDVSTVANNWDGLWPSIDSKDTKAAVEQNSTRYLPGHSLEQE
jgi:hypothetical protein